MAQYVIITHILRWTHVHDDTPCILPLLPAPRHPLHLLQDSRQVRWSDAASSLNNAPNAACAPLSAPEQWRLAEFT